MQAMVNQHSDDFELGQTCQGTYECHNTSMRCALVSISFSTGIFCLFSHFGHTSSEAARGRRRGSQRAARKPDTPRRNQDVARNPSVEWAAGSRFVDLAHETDSVVWGTTRMRTREAPPPSRVH